MKIYSLICLGVAFFGLSLEGNACAVKVVSSTDPAYKKDQCVDPGKVVPGKGVVVLSNGSSCYPPRSVAASKGGCASSSYRSDTNKPQIEEICFLPGDYNPVLWRREPSETWSITISSPSSDSNAYIWEANKTEFTWPLKDFPLRSNKTYIIYLDEERKIEFHFLSALQGNNCDGVIKRGQSIVSLPW